MSLQKARRGPWLRSAVLAGVDEGKKADFGEKPGSTSLEQCYHVRTEIGMPSTLGDECGRRGYVLYRAAAASVQPDSSYKYRIRTLQNYALVFYCSADFKVDCSVG